MTMTAAWDKMVTQSHLSFPILDGEALEARINPDNPSCPFHASKYVGNREAVDEILEIAYAAFQTRFTSKTTGRIMCPRLCPKRICLFGRPSTGKTTFVKKFATEVLKLPYCDIAPDTCSDSDTLFARLKEVFEDRDIDIVEEGEGYILPPGVLFIDEVHLLSSKVQDSLLKMTEANDGILLCSDGKRVDCRNLCIIIATTSKGKLREAFKTRFRQIVLNPHTTEEVAKIIAINQPNWTDDDCLSVAKLKPIPREAKDFADSVNLCASRRKISVQEAIKVVARREGVCEGGVSAAAIKVLSLLHNEPDGLSRNNLCAALGIELSEFENDILPCLLANDLHPAFISITNRHLITIAGQEYIKATIAKGEKP